MKIRISYFYQVRHFKKNMIPISTTLSDPLWYHDFTKNYMYNFFDKRGILNGMRYEPIADQGKLASLNGCACPCELRNQPHTSCAFLDTYRKNLENIDFERMIAAFEDFAKEYQERTGITDEIIMVFIVYETPQNQCSERAALIDWVRSHGYDCDELEYPIKEKYAEIQPHVV